MRVCVGSLWCQSSFQLPATQLRVVGVKKDKMRKEQRYTRKALLPSPGLATSTIIS